MDATATRKLSEDELRTRSARLAVKVGELESYRERKRSLTADLNADIKTADTDVQRLAQELRDGFEILTQGDLFADPVEPDTGAVVTQATAEESLAAVGEVLERIAESEAAEDAELAEAMAAPPEAEPHPEDEPTNH